jgi:hypothetical protein
MAQNGNYLGNTRSAKKADTPLQRRAAGERKQGLEIRHARGVARGQNDGGKPALDGLRRNGLVC